MMNILLKIALSILAGLICITIIILLRTIDVIIQYSIKANKESEDNKNEN